MRSAEGEGPSASCKEIKSLLGQEVTDMARGIKYYESTLLMVPGVPYSPDILVSALFQILMLLGIKGSWANMNAIQALTFILADIEMENNSNVIVDAVAENLSEQFDLARQEVAAVMQG